MLHEQRFFFLASKSIVFTLSCVYGRSLFTGYLTNVINPTDTAMRATGVEPKYHWASASEMRWRSWYQWRQFQAVRGEPYKAMSYDFLRENLRKAASGADISLRAVSTHAFRKAAAQKGKESGVPVANNLCHGMWNLGDANGAYDGLIPSAPMMTVLSGRSADCLSPVTPRLSVEVADALQRTICPWLADEEATYTERVARVYRCQDQALLDFFSLIRMERAVFSRPGRRASLPPACPPTQRSSATRCSTTKISATCARRWPRSWAMAAVPWRRLSHRYFHCYRTPSRWR